jgi:hypothetical protein
MLASEQGVDLRQMRVERPVRLESPHLHLAPVETLR